MSAPIFSMASGRALRREKARRQKRGQKAARGAGYIGGPVAAAVVRQGIEEQIDRLRTGSAIHAYTGANAAMLANLAGRLVYIVCHAAGVHGLGETPEARILAGTANALADIAETPAELERQRGAVIAGLQAIDRLMPKLHTFSLAAGSMELDNLLNTTSGMGTADVRRALGMQP